MSDIQTVDLPAPAGGSESVAVVRSIYDAFACGDVARIFALADPACSVYQSSRLPWGGRYEGHEGLGAFLTKLTSAIVSQVETERVIDDEEGHVVASGVTRGTVRATGRAFAVVETHVWTVRDGRIVRFEAYIDTAATRAALGLD